MAILRLRSIPHRPGLVAILRQASCLDAGPSPPKFARALPARPSENKRGELPGNFRNSSTARIPSMYIFFAPVAWVHEKQHECRCDLTSAELQTRVVLDRTIAAYRSPDDLRKTRLSSQFFRHRADRKGRVEF